MFQSCLIGFAGACLAASTTLAAVSYDVTDIGPYGIGFPSSKGVTINDAGDIVATMKLGPSSADCRTVVYVGRTGASVDLGTIFPGSTSLSKQTYISTANNNLDVLAGCATVVAGGRTAFKTTSDHGTTWSAWSGDIGTIPNGFSTVIYAVNDSGLAAGEGMDTSYRHYAMTYSMAGGITKLLAAPTPGTFYAGAAYAVNNSGSVVGEYYPGSYSHAFLGTGAGFSDITPSGAITAQAFDISDSGLIAISATFVIGQAQHVFLYSNGVATDLGYLGLGSVPEAINKAGDIVGDIMRSGYGGFIYSGGVMRDAADLIDPAWSVRMLTDINNSGVIVGVGYYNGALGNPRVIRLTKAVDPAANTLLSISAVPGQPSQKALTFSPLVAGRTYTPQYSSEIAPGDWQPLMNTTQIDNGLSRTVIDLNSAADRRFYRIQVSPP